MHTLYQTENVTVQPRVWSTAKEKLKLQIDIHSHTDEKKKKKK